ncbi:MAG TPA: hypothetical protein DCQ31_02985 [Bacteroidales bacterium]|nr:hypothetical protein [Bacteroidales bacterium]
MYIERNIKFGILFFLLCAMLREIDLPKLFLRNNILPVLKYIFELILAEYYCIFSKPFFSGSLNKKIPYST